MIDAIAAVARVRQEHIPELEEKPLSLRLPVKSTLASFFP
jgi:hypothetical protein